MEQKEDRIQAECVKWFIDQFPKLRKSLIHVPNGEKRDKITANKLKAMGVVAGVNDLIFVFRGRVHWIEMKKPTGKPSPKQKQFHSHLASQLFKTYVIDNVQDFKSLITSLMVGNSKKLIDWEYKKKVYDYLFKMPVNTEIELLKICNPDSTEKFISVVRSFVDERLDMQNKFEIEFSNDYSKLVKNELDQDLFNLFNFKE